MDTIKKLRALLAAPDSLAASAAPISRGVLRRSEGDEVAFEFREGLDFLLANACDSSWGAFNLRLLHFIQDMGLDNAALEAVLDSVQLDDAHWKWLLKSSIYQGDEYRWFFLVAEDAPQAACLIFHPKASAFDGRNIFYIEYVAVAPWNRSNPMAERTFKGVGRLLIGLVSKFAVEQLNLQPGYSLHALPKAVVFYEALGMHRFASLDKEGLPFFELPADRCVEGVVGG